MVHLAGAGSTAWEVSDSFDHEHSLGGAADSVHELLIRAAPEGVVDLRPVERDHPHVIAHLVCDVLVHELELRSGEGGRATLEERRHSLGVIRGAEALLERGGVGAQVFIEGPREPLSH